MQHCLCYCIIRYNIFCRSLLEWHFKYGDQPVYRQQALKLKEDCLLDLKTRLIDQANMIQKRFEIETGKLTIPNPKTFFNDPF